MMCDASTSHHGVPMFLSVGHSSHKPEALVDFLLSRGVTDLIDVRSVPYSRFNRGFNMEPFQARLAASGVEYFWRGETLGGRRERDDTMALTLDRMVAYYARRPKRRPVMMCSEGAACDCHRHHWLTGYLLQCSEVGVTHIHPTKPDVDPSTMEFRAFENWPKPRPFRARGPGIKPWISLRGYASEDELRSAVKKDCPAALDTLQVEAV